MLLSHLGNTADALQSNEQALTIRRQLASDHPQVSRYAHALAGTLSNMGNLHMRSGAVSDSLTSFQEAISISEKLVEAYPEETELSEVSGKSFRRHRRCLPCDGKSTGSPRGLPPVSSVAAGACRQASKHRRIPLPRGNGS